MLTLCFKCALPRFVQHTLISLFITATVAQSITVFFSWEVFFVLLYSVAVASEPLVHCKSVAKI